MNSKEPSTGFVKHTHLPQDLEGDYLLRFVSSLPFLCVIFDLQGNVLHVSPSIFKDLVLWAGPKTLENMNVFRDLNPQFYEAGARDYLRRAYKGQCAYIYDVPTAVEQVRDLITADLDFYIPQFSTACLFPVFEKGSVKEIAVIFVPQNGYSGNPLALRAREWINDNWSNNLAMDQLAVKLGVSPGHIARIFKKAFGVTPAYYHRRVRLNKVKEALVQPNASVKTAFYACGLDYNGSMARAFKRLTGYTPREYQRVFSKPASG